MRRANTSEIPNVDVIDNNRNNVVCDTILSMFGPRWTKPDAERLVQYTNGNLDIAVQEILRHDATGKSPMEWMISEDSASVGIRNRRTQPMYDADESKSEPMKAPTKTNLHTIDTELVNFLLSERDGYNHNEKIDNGQQQLLEDRKPSALSGDDKYENERLFVPPVDNSLVHTSIHHVDSCSSLSESEINSLSHNSHNFSRKMRNTRHHIDTHNEHPQLPDSIPITSLNLGLPDSNKTHTLNSQHDISRHKATLYRFLDSMKHGSDGGTSHKSNVDSSNEQNSQLHIQSQQNQTFDFSQTEDLERLNLLAALELERAKYEKKLNQIQAMKNQFIPRNSCPPSFSQPNQQINGISNRSLSDGRILSPPMLMDSLLLDDDVSQIQERPNTQNVKPANLQLINTSHNSNLTPNRAPNSMHQQQNIESNKKPNILFKNDTINPSNCYDKDDIDLAIEASLQSNRAEIDESEQLKLALKESLETKPPSRDGHIEENELQLALAVSMQEIVNASDRGALRQETYNNSPRENSSSFPHPQGLHSSIGSNMNRVSPMPTERNHIAKPTIFERSTTVAANIPKSNLSGFVRGAGLASVNGKYHRVGSCNGVGMYRKPGIWEGKPVTFTLYRCLLNNGDRKWFISIVPEDVKPGTDEDRDFYVAPGSSDHTMNENELPPEDGWTTLSPYGRPAAPLCHFPGHLHSIQSNNFDNSFRTTLERIDSENSSIDAILVSRAGSDPINGTFVRLGTHDGAPMYVKETIWKKKKVKVLLFRASLNRVTKRWLVTIIPEECTSPGSSMDIDLYYAQANPLDDLNYNKPPRQGWNCVNGFGTEPSPVCTPFCADTPASKFSSNNTDFSSDIGNHRSPQGTAYRNSSERTCSTNSKESQNSSHERIYFLDRNNKSQTRRVAMCVVCRQNPVSHVLIPCGHACLCSECASLSQHELMNWKCPIARCPVNAIMRFYGTLVESED